MTLVKPSAIFAVPPAFAPWVFFLSFSPPPFFSSFDDAPGRQRVRVQDLGCRVYGVGLPPAKPHRGIHTQHWISDGSKLSLFELSLAPHSMQTWT